MELNKTYSPSIEQQWYDRWMENKLFESKPDGRKAYTVVIPPPNVTGVLHMGHSLNETVQDVLARRARMNGFNVCWVPGTDHASIATEAKVVSFLKEQDIDKNKLSRDEFLKYAWEWKEKYGGIILQQLKKLGCSCDWNRTAFTMDEDYYAAVIRVFVELYEKGKIYRGVKMINWDPKAQTALSDEEVNYKEVKSNLYYVRYLIDNEKEEWITVATTRPETILGDTAVCVHPNDERYKHLHGKFCFVPLINKRVPIIVDDYIDIEFGTGALKVTPAHDLNDYNLGIKHKLEVVDTLNPDGTMSVAAQLYIGEDRFIVRKKIAKELEAKGHLLKIEEIMNKNGFSERTDVVIEPRLSMQWWCDMKEMAVPALNAVMNDDIKFYPAKFKNTYNHWMNNIKDWCISRQLWWGQRIPAWYDDKRNMVVAATYEEALKKYELQFGEANSKSKIQNPKLFQDEDVLDTWFSSWLWPFEVFGWNKNENSDELNYYYPTDTLVTAPEIIFFWVARMIMAGFEFKKQIPFKHVYFTGIVRDKQGRKMSKSLGNSPDLLAMIENYGADAVRFGILYCSPAGNDLLFDEKLVEQGRNFNNKLWNVLRLIKGWEITDAPWSVGNRPQQDANNFSADWFASKLSSTRIELEKQFAEFNVSVALKLLYNLIWDDFCSWYLEMIKPEFGKPIDRKTFDTTVNYFEQLLQLLHPFMPFVTEELFHQLKARSENDFINNTTISPVESVNQNHVEEGEKLKQIVTFIRELRNKNAVKPKEQIDVKVKAESFSAYTDLSSLISKLAGLKLFEETKTDIDGALTFVVKNDSFFVLIEKEVNAENEMERLKKELEYNEGFLQSVMKKLGNEKFVANAKADVLEKEKTKAADAENKIRIIKEQLQKFSAN